MEGETESKPVVLGRKEKKIEEDVELFEEHKMKKKKKNKMKKERRKASKENKAKMEIRVAEESERARLDMLNENYGLLASRPNDPTVWKERRSLVGDYMSDWNKKMDLVRCFAEQHPDNDDLFWTSRFTLLGEIGSEIANKELECTKNFLPKGTKNYQALSYREWIIQNIDRCLWKSELQYYHEILEEDKLDVSVWIQMCRAARQLNHKMAEESRLNEAFFAKKAIMAHPGNEGPWTYLKVLYAEHVEALYTNPDLESIFVDVLAEAANRVKLAWELDPDYNAAFSSVANRGCVHALNLVVDLMIKGYKMNRKRRLVNAVNVLYAYPSWRYIRVSPYTIRDMGKGIFWNVCAAMFSVDACRVRYCHTYRGFHWFRYSSLFLGRGPQFEMGDTLCDDDDDYLSSQLVERFDDLLRGTVFERHPNWKDRLKKTYSNKQTRTDSETLEEDLKWDIRQYVVKDNGTNAAALKELQFTTDIIKLDAYNRRAWLHRQWVFQTFGGDWEDDAEVEFCGELLEKDACNSYAWDQRYFAVTRCVKKIDAAKHPDRICGDAHYQKVLQLELSFEQKKIEEADYAITKFISVEPENPFPWAHIIGVYSTYPSQLGANEKVRDAILEVLGNARECALALNFNDGIMGDGEVMVNARGIINALNMLLDLAVNYSYDICEDEKFRDVMIKLCPDSCFEYPPNYVYDTLDRIIFILKRMVKALPDFDLSWDNAGDRLLGGL